MKIKLLWHSAAATQPAEGMTVEVMRPVSDWPQYMRAVKTGNEWYSAATGEKIDVLKWRFLK